MNGLPAAFNPPPIKELTAIFPQFEILELIGLDGMGAVYKVRQKDLQGEGFLLDGAGDLAMVRGEDAV